MSDSDGYPALSFFNGYTPPQLQGLGTVEEPYLITNALELGAIVFYGPKSYYLLKAPIDLSGIHWGIAVVPSFGGIFDGNGLVISNLTIQSGGYLGLFGQLESGSAVKNIGALNVNIKGLGDYTGGLVGFNIDGNIAACSSTGTVVGNNHVGGLVGFNRLGIMKQCYSMSTVNSTGNYIGGLVGENGVTGIRSDYNISNCFSIGIVDGNDYIGGLVGYNYGRIKKCYSAGQVHGNKYIGGLLGENMESDVSDINDCFWDLETSLTSDGVGDKQNPNPDGVMGKTTDEMQTRSTFTNVGWDFVDETDNGTEDIWWIDEGNDYPRFWWEIEPFRLPVIELDAASFDTAIAVGVVLVDFYATWCSHCTTQAPILEDVADQLEGRAQVAKLDVDNATGIAQRYGITAIPTLIVFKEGVETKRFIGVTSAEDLVTAVLAELGSTE
jgi:thioredoxin